MNIVDKYRWGNVTNIPVSNNEIDSLATLESIKRRQGWMIATQVATVAAIANQTHQTTDALRLVNDTLESIGYTIEYGFDSLESSIERLEANLIENLNEIKWYLSNVDQKLDQLINLVKFSGATKSAEYNKQGFILYKIESFNEAINQLNKSLQENPLNLEAYINLGFVYMHIEKIDESIKYFEKASKLVKEDYSYFEDVSIDRLKSTEIFILENLSSFYLLQEQYQKSIEVLNKILSIDIDKNTEILTKYKLAKCLCLSNDRDGALEIINQLINNQYFEPIALAVANPEFSPISSRILQILQNKLENVKKSFETDGNNLIGKLNCIEIDDEKKEQLIDIVVNLNNQINTNSEYSILLTSEFIELHKNFLESINIISELISKVQKDFLLSNQDFRKLKNISSYNSEYTSRYTYDYCISKYSKKFSRNSHFNDIPKISHEILLSKIQSNVKNGIESKMIEYQEAFLLFHAMDKIIMEQLNKYIELCKDNLVEFIYEKFDFSQVVKTFIPFFLKHKKDNNMSIANKAIEEYMGLIDNYIDEDDIDEDGIDEDVIKSICDPLGVDFEKVLKNYRK